MSVRILAVADIHHFPQDAPPKLCSHGRPLLEKLVEGGASEACDFFVDLGDRIDDRGREQDLVSAREIADIFARIRCPRGHVMGNHDSYHLTHDEWADVLGCTVRSTSCDVGGLHLVMFSPAVDNKRGQFDYSISPQDIDWLRDDLANATLPVLVFTHVPLMAGKMLGNYYVEGKDNRAHHANSAAVRTLLEEHDVLMVVAGHVHWNSWTCLHGIHYITIQSLTESFTTWPHPSGAFTAIEVGEAIEVRVSGRDPMHLKLPRRQPGQRWLTRPR